MLARFSLSLCVCVCEEGGCLLLILLVIVWCCSLQVTVKTSLGDLDVELWPKEAPKVRTQRTEEENDNG